MHSPSYEPQKGSGMDHTAFTLQIHHTCLYLVAFTRWRHYWIVVASSHLIIADYYLFIDPQEDERLSWPS